MKTDTIESLQAEAALLTATEVPAGTDAMAVQANAPAVPTIDVGQEIAGILQGAAAIMAPVFPSLKTIYTKEACAEAGAALAAVCLKRQWLTGGLMGGYSEEIAAGFVVLPMAVATYHGVKQDLAAHQEKAKEPSSTRPPTPPRRWKAKRWTR